LDFKVTKEDSVHRVHRVYKVFKGHRDHRDNRGHKDMSVQWVFRALLVLKAF
jgi:hypothetical protein